MKRGQSTIEMALIFSIVAAGLLAIAVFWRSALRANVRGNADMFSDEQYALDSTETSAVPNYDRKYGPAIQFSNSRIDVVGHGAVDLSGTETISRPWGN
jgi:hypothetical protein